MSGLDYRHVEYNSHEHTSEPTEESTFQSSRESHALTEASVAPLSSQSNAPHVSAPLQQPNADKQGEGSNTTTSTVAKVPATVSVSNSPASLSLQVFRPIPASTALKMIRTIIETIMFMRGQIPTTWQILQRTLNQERQKMNHYHHDNCQSGIRSDNLDSIPTANVALIRKLEGFLGPTEEMFTALGDAVMREQRRRAETRSSEMLVISVAFILGSTLSTPKELYHINVGPIQPLSYCVSSTASSSVSSGILQPTMVPVHNGHFVEEELSQREENEWIRRLAQLIITNGYEYPTSSAPRMRAHLVMKAPPGREGEGLLPRQTLVLPESEQSQGLSSTPSSCFDNQQDSDSSSMLSPLPPCPSTVRYPVYTCHIIGPETYRSVNNASTVYTMDRVPPPTSIWYQAGPSLPTLSNLD
ncbi:hypothetical protein BGW42_003049 [Actinomortierella wolfii]|nr:hypothetical protein BGW42_003049 [Actinomortierella wolfii]